MLLNTGQLLLAIAETSPHGVVFNKVRLQKIFHYVTVDNNLEEPYWEFMILDLLASNRVITTKNNHRQ